MKRSLLLLAIVASLGATPLLFADDDAPKNEPKKDEPKKDEPEKKDDEKKGDDKKSDKGEGASDLDSLEAKALASKLHVPANWNGKEGTVDLTYDFSTDDQLSDWKIAGADKVDLTDGRGPAGKGGGGKGGKGGKGPGGMGGPPGADMHGLRVAVASDGVATAILEPIEMKGDFTIEITLRLAQFGPSCDFAYLVGFKGKEAIGIRFGDQYVKVSSHGLSPITKNKPSVERFTTRNPVNVKIERKGVELKTWIDGVERPAKTLAPRDLDGKLGILASNNVRVVVARFHLKGAIDRSKL